MLVQLADYVFTVVDAVTGQPVQGAQCTLSNTYTLKLEGIGGYTDSSGVCVIDTSGITFPILYYSVYKAGYTTVRDSVPGTQINVALMPTAALYYVTVNAGAGGAVDPSGVFQVQANSRLSVEAVAAAGYVFDHWVVNGANGGTVNPTSWIIDRDSYSIQALFKVSEQPPPPPPTEWPVTRSIHIFDNLLIKGGWQEGVSRSSTVSNIDLSSLIGGKIEYSIVFEKAGFLGVADAFVEWNGVKLAEHTFPVGSVGQSFSGSIDLTGRVSLTNSLRVGFQQGLGEYNELRFDVWVMLGYSEEPVVEPGVPPKYPWADWPWYYWAGLGLGGVVLLYLVAVRGRSQVVVVRD